MLSKEDLEKLQAEHKRIAHVVGKRPAGAKESDPSPWEAVFRKPTRAEYKRFRAMANNAETAPDAQEQLARATVVYPSREAFDALLEDYPAITEAVAKDIGALAGFAVEQAGKA